MLYALDIAVLAFWVAVCLVAALVLFALAVGCGFAAARINERKGRSARAGFWWGFALPLIGLAVIAALPAASSVKSSPTPAPTAVPSRKVLTRIAVGVGATAIIAPIAGVVAYTQFINDPAPAFDESDLSNLLSTGTSSTTGVVLAGLLNTSAVTSEPDATATDVCAAAAAVAGDGAVTASSEVTADDSGEASDLDGVWVSGDASEVGYRIPEVLAGVDTEGVGRTSDVEGSLTVANGVVTDACFVAETATITSDEGNRDRQFRSRIMSTDEFPQAAFTLTEPIVLDPMPEAGGDAVTAEATGILTLRGVTQPVTFEVTVQVGDDVAGVLGSIPVTFADYGIPDPSSGPAQVGEDGTLEFLLQFTPA